MSESTRCGRVFFDPAVLSEVPRGRLRRRVVELSRHTPADGGASLVVARASSLIRGPEDVLPAWCDAETRYLVLLDVPEPAVLRLPSILRLHRPDQRMHVTRDDGTLRRLVISLSREWPWEGILDAYVLLDSLVVVHGDMTVRSFPIDRVPGLKILGPQGALGFEIAVDGSFLHWPAADLHLGPSQLLQAVDPMYMADVEIERYAREKISVALRDMRSEQGLTQSEIDGLSDRHVRRLEKEEIRLTADAAERFAEAFRMSLPGFLSELGRRITGLRDAPDDLRSVRLARRRP